jgi:hypothetical protein
LRKKNRILPPHEEVFEEEADEAEEEVEGEDDEVGESQAKSKNVFSMTHAFLDLTCTVQKAG